MIKQNQRLLNILNLVLDTVLTYAAYYAAVWVRFTSLAGFWSVDLYSGSFKLSMLCYCAVITLAYYFFRVYAPQRYRKISKLCFSIIAINTVCVLFFFAFLYLNRAMDVSRGFLAFFYIISTAAVLFKHIVTWLFMRFVRKAGFNQKHIIVIGSGRLVEQYVRNVEQNRELGLIIDGFVCDDQREIHGEYLGDFSQLYTILSQRPDTDEIVIALNPQQQKMLDSVISVVGRFGIKTSIIPSYNDYMSADPHIETVGESKLINLYSMPLDDFVMQAVKRCMDIVFSLLAIILLSPLLLTIALGVKLSSPGPVFFLQERVGYNRKPFTMIKFRSMVVNASEKTGWSTAEDQRRTVFGRFIRKTSLDELPQLFNVLAGQMSLVGPRPEVPYYVDQFRNSIPQYLLRQRIRPGMTGWAQVNGLRGDTDIKGRVEYDLWYINNWCIRLDMVILLRTVMGGFLNEEVIKQ